MKYEFWKNYDFIDDELALKFDTRLEIALNKLEDFFYLAKIDDYNLKSIEFILAGSCIKSDKFKDIDIFINKKEDLEKISLNINENYLNYVNNAKTYYFDNETIQLVHRERFLNKTLEEIVDIFDFFSTKIAFKCELDTKTFRVKVVEHNIKEEFVEYCRTKKNGLTRVNSNPFVSLQRGINFLKRGDNISFFTILLIIERICEIKGDKNIEKYYEKLQGDDEKLSELKEAIHHFMNKNHN